MPPVSMDFLVKHFHPPSIIYTWPLVPTSGKMYHKLHSTQITRDFTSIRPLSPTWIPKDIKVYPRYDSMLLCRGTVPITQIKKWLFSFSLDKKCLSPVTIPNGTMPPLAGQDRSWKFSHISFTECVKYWRFLTGSRSYFCFYLSSANLSSIIMFPRPFCACWHVHE